jgi:lysophospholipase L1-like esterase
MQLVMQDARSSRRFYNAFECWGNPALGGTPGTFQASYPVQGGTCGTVDIGLTDGETFAQSLANVDILVIELGTNDQSVPLGTLGDATTAGTYYGNMRWVVETYLNAKPTLRLAMVTLQYNAQASPATNQLYADATVAYANSMGVPVLNMFNKGGVNAITGPALLQGDQIHPNTFDYSNFYGPTIAQFLQSIF